MRIEAQARVLSPFNKAPISSQLGQATWQLRCLHILNLLVLPRLAQALQPSPEKLTVPYSLAALLPSDGQL